MGSDQPAPLALPQNQLSTQHPPSSSVLQQFHACKWQHHQRCETAPSMPRWCPAFPCDFLATLALLQAPTPVSTYLSSPLLLRFQSSNGAHTQY